MFYIPTVTWNVHVAKLPTSSVTVHDTVVAPTGKVKFVEWSHEIEGILSMLSIACTSGQVTFVVETKMSPGQVIFGLSTSVDIKICTFIKNNFRITPFKKVTQQIQ